MDDNQHNTRILDGYRLIRFLGRGGFGEVWLCRSEAMGDFRAIKFIPTTHAESLEKEYESLLHFRKAAARLRSPHLVSIEHVNRNEAGLYYVMPLADGVAGDDPSDPTWQPLSLTAKIHAQVKQRKWLSSREVTAIVLPILQALQTLADAGLVHRDVKPENILYFNGQPCLGDISLLGADASVITRRGTPGYATPSWYAGGHPDMYGIAATLYTVLTGNLPDKMGRSSFLWPPQGETSLSESERMEWKRLHGVIRRATEEKVTERFVDFAAMAGNLRNDLPVKAKLPRVIISALTLVGIAASVVIAGFRSKHAEPPPPVAKGQPGKGQTPKANAQPPAPTEGQSVPISPSTQPPPAIRRSPKIVDSKGIFPSMREKVLKAIPAAIERSSSGGGPRLDLDEYARKTAIRNAYDNRDYAVCLGLLDERVKTCPELRGNQTCSLFRAYLLKRLDRAHDAEIELNRANVQPGTVNTPDGLRLHQVEERLILWEALGCYREAREFLSQTIPPVVESIPDKHSALESWNDAQRLYNLRARMQILDGDYAGALADENAALALPPMRFDVPGVHVTPAQVQQTQLNTVVMNWELLEQEFPAYGDYLEANGSPEPKPDLRNLDDE